MPTGRQMIIRFKTAGCYLSIFVPSFHWYNNLERVRLSYQATSIDSANSWSMILQKFYPDTIAKCT
jgi:hypothetical protein